MGVQMSKNGSYYIIAVTCGYVEDAYVARLIFSTPGRRRFATPGEAVTELALDMYAKYRDELVEDKPKACCVKSFKKKEAKFCSICGCPAVRMAFSSERFMEFIKELHCTTNDSYGQAEWADGRTCVFLPWHHNLIGIQENEIVDISENAEQVLLCALFEAMPELMGNDDKYVHEQYLKDPSSWSMWKHWADIKEKGHTRT